VAEWATARIAKPLWPRAALCGRRGVPSRQSSALLPAFVVRFARMGCARPAPCRLLPWIPVPARLDAKNQPFILPSIMEPKPGVRAGLRGIRAAALAVFGRHKDPSRFVAINRRVAAGFFGHGDV